ncbi:MAG: GNAT family N-acetyltransferase [Bacteroidota bacterium]
MTILYSERRDLELKNILYLYEANNWESAKRPQELQAALRNSRHVVTAWDGGSLVGLGNAISDGHLVVYYPHLLVHPDYHGKGIGKELLSRLQRYYQGFHMQILVANPGAINFYASQGFEKAGDTQAMWIHHSTEDAYNAD